MTLKEIRNNCKITQMEAAYIVGVSIRTYVSYENNEEKADFLKLERIMQKLLEFKNNDFSFTDKILLITGGTGSFGHAIVDRFLKTDIKEIRILSRDEKKQDDMRKEYNNSKPKLFLCAGTLLLL